jgi:hypothetical protein
VGCHLLCKDTHKSRHHTPSVNGGVMFFKQKELI